TISNLSSTPLILNAPSGDLIITGVGQIQSNPGVAFVANGNVSVTQNNISTAATGFAAFTSGNSTSITAGITTNGGALAAVAGSNVVFNVGSNVNTSGGAATVVAGANFSGSGAGPVSITGASATGGRIDLTGAASFSTAAAAANTNGGN